MMKAFHLYNDEATLLSGDDDDDGDDGDDLYIMVKCVCVCHEKVTKFFRWENHF